jgi:hypothetical protein
MSSWDKKKGKFQRFLNTSPTIPMCCASPAMDTAPSTCGLRSELSSNTPTKLPLNVVHGALKLCEPQQPGNVVSAVTIGTAASSSWVKTCNGLFSTVTENSASIRPMKTWSLSLSVLLVLSALAQQQHRPNWVIYGLVTTSAGEPAKSLRIRAMPLGIGGTGGGVFETKTNKQGEYRFQKLPLWGKYRVYADDEAAGYSRVSTGPTDGRLQEVEITPENYEAEFNFSLPRKAGSVQIHLTNRRTGAAISQMTVWVALLETPDSGLFTLTGRSDDLILVPPDRNLLLHVTEEGFREWDESVGRGKPINVASASRLTLDVQLDPLD